MTEALTSNVSPVRSRRIVITTLGSYGDLHPYVAIGLGLRARGHTAVIATGECYRAKIERLGLEFQAIRPDCDWVNDPQVMRRIMDLRFGTVRAVLGKVLPYLKQSYEDLAAATRGADLFVSHMPWGARLVAEKTGVPWVSTMVTPMGFFSAYDLPVIPLIPRLSRSFRRLSPSIWTVLLKLSKWATRPLAADYYRARKELGLPRCRDWNPLSDSHSPQRVLALFSPLIAPPQPDWPSQTVVTGFPLFDQDGSDQLPPELDRFLGDGPPPLVFTLASSAAMVADRFFEHSMAAAQRLGQRAVLITGRNPQNHLQSLPEGIAAFEYAPFSKLFPRASVVVHPGGIGTTGIGMRSGRPTLVVPFAHDQPDNADRVTRLGISRTISRSAYRPSRIVKELDQLLTNPAYAQRAKQVADQVQQEDGVATACDALENFLASRITQSPS